MGDQIDRKCDYVRNKYMNDPLGVPLPVRTSLTPPDRVYVTDTCADTCEDTCPDTCTDQVQNIYTEVPSEWPPLPPVPPHQYPNMPKPPPSCDTLVGDHCVEMSHEELERQVCTNLLPLNIKCLSVIKGQMISG